MNLQKLNLILSSLAVLFTLTVASASAWWSSWYTPNFTGSYSPSTYKHGQWDDNVGGGTEVFGSHMKWNQTKANGIKAIASNISGLTSFKFFMT